MIIVTHKKPHLDEVVGAWLLKTFDPKFKDATFQFIPYLSNGGQVPPGDDYVAIGIGQGKYDEHALQHRMSTTKLIYEDLMHRGLIPNDVHEDKALAWLIDYAHKEDVGQWEITDPNYTSFSIPSILRGHWLVTKDDQAEMKLGLEIVEAVMAQLNERAKFLNDWEKRIEFNTKWGKAVGVHSSYRQADAFAYHLGFVLRVQTDPAKPFGDFRAVASSDVDLTDIYAIVDKQEPGAWYFHQSKKILTSNVDPATGKTPTKYSLQQLIDLVKV